MASRKPPSGPFPYPTTDQWAEHLYEAIVNTCSAEEVVPASRSAVFEALAPALGHGEAKRIVETRRSERGRFLRATAYHIERRGTDGALLLLNVQLHGAATLPWPLNDRTRRDWLHPTRENLARFEKLVAHEPVLVERDAAVKRAKDAQRRLTPTASTTEKDAAAAAVANAEFEYEQAQESVLALEKTLAERRPLPAVFSHREDDQPRAVLTTARSQSTVAAAVQRYAVDKLRKRGGKRSYDLVESLVQEGQRESTVVVLQQVPMSDLDGSLVPAWRAFQVTGNNRADARLQIYGLEPEQVLTGVPQEFLQFDGEPVNRRLILRGMGEILRRVSTRLNTDYDAGDDPDGQAQRAKRVAQVPARVVVGAKTPERLEEALRGLNVHDHLRGQLDYDAEDRGLGLWSTLVESYRSRGLLSELLTEEVTHSRILASDLDEAAISDALVGAGPLDPLAALLPAGEQQSPVALRDAAIRCITTMLFPPVPARPADLQPYARRDTGRYWPVVRATLQEAPFTQANGSKAKRRTDVWAAVVAQLFVNRGNLLAADGAFAAHDVQRGVRPDPRSLSALLAACRQGDPESWNVLVRRHLLPYLINAPEPFITSGQGSEKGEDRKGVRRPPTNAVHALVNAYTSPPHRVTRALLCAFAEAILHAPESAAERVPGLEPGTFWAPDEAGVPRDGILADKNWFDDTFPKTSTSRGKRGGEADNSVGDGLPAYEPGEMSIETSEDLPADPRKRVTQLRNELPARTSQAGEGLTDAIDQLENLVQHIEKAVAARKEANIAGQPWELRGSHIEDLRKLQETSGDIEPLLNKALQAVTEL